MPTYIYPTKPSSLSLSLVGGHLDGDATSEASLDDMVTLVGAMGRTFRRLLLDTLRVASDPPFLPGLSLSG